MHVVGTFDDQRPRLLAYRLNYIYPSVYEIMTQG
jgi:hypothetical protein